MYNLVIMDRQRSNHLKIKKYIEEAKLDYKVIGTATSVDQAERIITSKNVDLVIGDDAFVGRTGLQLFNTYKDDYPGLHIILFTDHKQYSQTKETLSHGRLDYLIKPVRKSDVVNSLKKMTIQIDAYHAKNAHSMALRDKYDANINQFKERFLMNLIYGSIRQSPYIYNQLDYFNIPYGEAFTIAVYKIDDYRRYQLALDEDEKQFLIFKVFSLIQDKMVVNRLGFAFISRYDEVTLLFTNTTDQIDIIDYCSDYHETIATDMAIQGTIGIGRTYPSPQAIHLSYNQSVDAILAHDYLGKNTVIHIDYVVRKNDVAYAYAADQENLIVKYAISGQIQKSLKSLSKVINSIQNLEGFEANFYRAFVRKLLAHLYRDGIASNYDFEESLNLSDLDDDIMYIENSQQALEHLQRVIHIIGAYVKDKKNRQEDDLLSRALDYVQAYYTSRISLTSAAQYLQTTPRHLEDIIFKAYEKKFYDFCMMVRINKAKNLLLTTTQSTAEIATNIGFNNSEYFVAIFKQQTRLTPSEFRHQGRMT